MLIRPYSSADRSACLDILLSNSPKFFAPAEKTVFSNWLQAQEKAEPAYPNIEKQRYYVLEQHEKVLACGGYYTLRGEPRASMAWGMVHNSCHGMGMGHVLLMYRIHEIRKQFPGCTLFLDTSQHTSGFFGKAGFSVTKITENYYCEGLHRYDMEAKWQ